MARVVSAISRYCSRLRSSSRCARRRACRWLRWSAAASAACRANFWMVFRLCADGEQQHEEFATTQTPWSKMRHHADGADDERIGQHQRCARSGRRARASVAVTSTRPVAVEGEEGERHEHVELRFGVTLEQPHEQHRPADLADRDEVAHPGGLRRGAARTAARARHNMPPRISVNRTRDVARQRGDSRRAPARPPTARRTGCGKYDARPR